MGLYDQFKTDNTLEQQGVWFEISDGVKFLIARAGGSNKKYRRSLDQRSKPYRAQLRNNTIDAEKLRELSMLAFVDACLLDWYGVTDAADEPLVFNRGNVLKVFAELPDVYDTLFEAASSSGSYRDAEVAEAGEL